MSQQNITNQFEQGPPALSFSSVICKASSCTAPQPALNPKPWGPQDLAIMFVDEEDKDEALQWTQSRKPKYPQPDILRLLDHAAASCPVRRMTRTSRHRGVTV
jgi:hypothetical protein